MAFVKKLDAAHAVIHTATVEVKTLTITGRQVTLAVYRQLPKQEIIDKQTGLIGIPWGTVNYHPPDDPWNELYFRRQHLHVVWQKDSLLFRSDTLAMPTEYEIQEEVISKTLEACSLFEKGKFTEGSYGSGKVFITLANNRREIFEQAQLEKGESFWLKLQDENNQRIDRWHDSYEQLEALDQLFIAV